VSKREKIENSKNPNIFIEPRSPSPISFQALESNMNTDAIIAANSSSESNDVEFAHKQTPPAPPTTPQHQPTKPASTNAPEKPPKLTIEPPLLKCQGCIEEQPNQLAHVHVGGCLEEAFNLVADDKVEENPEEKEYDMNDTSCPCYVRGCPGDCGTLWCGCIDVCRGRCGLRDPRDRW
jgi:hypothetical protein